MTYRKIAFRFIFGYCINLGISTCNIKILYTHVSIDKLKETVGKYKVHKYLVLLHSFCFNVSNIKRSKKNVNLTSLQ